MRIGFDGVALPGLARARDLEPLALLWIQLALQRGLGRIVSEPRSLVGGGRIATAAGRLPSQRGKQTLNVAPAPGSLSTHTYPPLCATMPYIVASPRPVPCLIAASLRRRTTVVG